MLRSAHKASCPTEFPGRFFVLQPDEVLGHTTAHLDDEDMSSHVIGRNLVEARRWLIDIWGLDEHFADRALNLAWEFRAPVQVIPATEGVPERTILLIDRNGLDITPFDLAKRPKGLIHV